MDVFTYTTTSKYSDLGPDGFLSNIGFLRIMQEAASLHSESIGYGPADTKTNNCAWIILGWKLKVLSRPVWNKKITIETYASVYGGMFSYRDFKMYDENKSLIAIASSKWVIVDYITKHIRKMPEDVCNNFNTKNEPVFGNKINLKLKEPDIVQNSVTYKVLRRDIDTNYHVNNLNYLNFAEEALPEDVYKANKINNIEIMYKQETKLNDVLTFNYSKIDENKHIVAIKTGDKLKAVIKMWEE